MADDRELLLNAARAGKTPAARKKAARLYREIYGQDVPAAEEDATPAAAGEEDAEKTPSTRPWDVTRDLLFPVADFLQPAEDVLNRAGHIAERATNAFTAGASRPVYDALGLSSPEERAALDRAYPLQGQIGEGLGYLASAARGPAALLDTGVRAAVRGGLRAGAGRLAAAASPATRAAATRASNLASGAASGVAENAFHGFGMTEGSLPERLEAAGEGAGAAAALGAGGEVVGDLVDAARAGIRREPWLRQYFDALESGRLARPEAAGTKDIPDAARRARDDFVRARAARVREGQAELEIARAPFLEETISREGMLQDIDEQLRGLRGADTMSNNPDLTKRLKVKRRDIRRAAKPRGPDQVVPPDPTYGDLIARRAALRKSANFNNPAPTDAQMQARAEYDLYRRAIQRDAPEEALLAEADAAKRAQSARREQDIVFRSENEVDRAVGGAAPDAEDLLDADAMELGGVAPAADTPNLRVNAELKGADFFRRAGDTNIPSERVRALMDELAATDPRYADIIEYVKDIKAREASNFHLVPPLDPPLRSATMLGGTVPFLAQQSRFLGAKLIDPAAKSIGPRARRMSRLVPLFRDPLDAMAVPEE